MSDFKERFQKVTEEIGVLAKSAENPHFKSKYADISAMIEQIRPIVTKHKMTLSQPSRINQFGRTEQGTVIEDWESDGMKESWVVMPEIENPQKMFAASTYFRRMTLQNLFAIQAEDDDGNAAADSKPRSRSSSKGKSKSSNMDF